MKQRTCLFLLVVCVFPFSSVCRADPSDLFGGALLVHHVAELSYSTDPPAGGWCEAYSAYAISACSQQVTRIDVQGYRPVTWFVLAAWYDNDREWCGTQFGLGGFDAGLFGFLEYHPCYPDAGLEISTDGWPGPEEGTAFVATGTPWEGNLLPVYFFGGYAYAYAGPGLIPLAVDPTTDFAGFSNCANPAESYSAGALGGLGINSDGLEAYPETPPSAVCCIDDECYLMPEEECIAAGGLWYAWLDTCESDSNPSDPERYVCCVEAECHLWTEPLCNVLGGEWHPELKSCTPNPCDPSRLQEASWGRIKHIYR